MLRRGWPPILAPLCVAVLASFGTSPAGAQLPPGPSAADLAAARSLFAVGLGDEDAGRFADALWKFKSVRAVKNTSAIEYRIGTCYEGLNQPAAAYVAYQKAVDLADGDAQTADVANAASRRLKALVKRVARLTLTWPDGAPPEAKVRVDGADRAYSSDDAPEPIVLDPGHHVVIATAAGHPPSRTDVLLPEGGELSLVLTFALAVPVASPKPPAPELASTPPLASRQHSGVSAGWVTTAGGVGLLGAAAAALLLRDGDIAKLNHACPGGQCPPGSDRSDLDSTRSRALWEGPAAGVLFVAGAVATVAGIYFLLSSRSGTMAAVHIGTPMGGFAGAASGGVRVEGDFF